MNEEIVAKNVGRLLILYVIYNTEDEFDFDKIDTVAAAVHKAYEHDYEPLLRLDNWLSQEYDHVLSALNVLVKLEDIRLSGVVSPIHFACGPTVELTLRNLHKILSGE